MAGLVSPRRHLHFKAGFVYQAAKPRREAPPILQRGAMRAEAEKFAESIRQSLALLRRHL